jgi:outer membrane protein assembly factor BamB
MRTLSFLVFLASSAVAANWPSWRGSEGLGISPETNLPLTWSATENVKWKIPLPEQGNSTPVVWENKIFLTQNVGNRRSLMCLDRRDGKLLWQAGPVQKEAERTHRTNPYCSASPVTDGERVIAWFGSAGLWCWSLDGEERWHLDVGRQDHEWGYAASPVIEGGTCFVNAGPGDPTFFLAVDKTSGKERWRVRVPMTKPRLPRNDGFDASGDGVIGSWSTPLPIKAAGRTELIMCWPERVVAHDPANGNELWNCGGLNPLFYTSPMYGDGVVIASGGYGGSTAAVKPGGSGDVTMTHRLWFRAKDKQRIGSGVITGGHLYILNTPGTAQCVDLKTGETVWEQRLVGSSANNSSWSSMMLAGDRLYVPNQSSDTFVLRAAPKFEQLAVNALGDGMTNSSIVASNGEIFIRTHAHLWCIGEKK